MRHDEVRNFAHSKLLERNRHVVYRVLLRPAVQQDCFVPFSQEWQI